MECGFKNIESCALSEESGWTEHWAFKDAAAVPGLNPEYSR